MSSSASTTKARDWMAIVHCYNKYKLSDNPDQQTILQGEFAELFEKFIDDYPNPFVVPETDIPEPLFAHQQDEPYECQELSIEAIDTKLKKLLTSKAELENYIKLGELELKLFAHSETPIVEEDRYRHLTKVEKLRQLLQHTNEKIKAYSRRREKLLASS
ncbi:hypothetical protein [Agarilytica rhodophyticola]|uniref:hypothetical protein n=1 Tax=Agarilytica rhodophyticola TaxID=1737490 RepID=UPI000CD99C33|nr:hypothetical protein [Agarilytica rhodophyticola]